VYKYLSKDNKSFFFFTASEKQIQRKNFNKRKLFMCLAFLGLVVLLFFFTILNRIKVRNAFCKKRSVFQFGEQLPNSLFFFFFLELCLEAGIDVNAGNEDDETPIGWAVNEENIPCTKLLLDWKADPNITYHYHAQ
jgi:hypothetical protein